MNKASYYIHFKYYFAEIVKESVIEPNGTLRSDILKRPFFSTIKRIGTNT